MHSSEICYGFVCLFTTCMIAGMLIALIVSPSNVEDYQLGRCVNTNTKDAGVCNVHIYTLSNMKKRKVSLKSACVLLPEPRIGVFYDCWRAGFSDSHRITFTPPKYDHHKKNKQIAKERNDNIVLSLIIVSSAFAGVLVLACVVIGLHDCFMWCRQRCKYTQVGGAQIIVEPEGELPPHVVVAVDNDEAPPPYQKNG